MSTYAELKAQANALFEQAEAARRQERQAAISHIRSQMAAYGLTADDLTLSSSPRSSNRAAAKYRGPEGQSWSGHGRRPKWVFDLLASGQDLSQFSVG